MADKPKGITIEFRGETTKLDKAMRQIRSESKDIDKELRAVNQALKFNPQNVTLLSQKEEILTQKIKSSKDQLQQFKSAQNQLKAEGIEKNTTEWRSLEREIIEAESKVKHFETALDQLKNVQGVNELQQKLDSLGGKMQRIGGGLKNTGIGASVGAAGAIALGKQFVDSAQVQLEAEGKLTEAYSSHVKGGKAAAKATMEYASALQQQGVVGDEVTLAGAGILANYTDNNAQINKLLPIMDNLIVKQKGLNGTTADAEGIAKSLGKALSGNAGAFTKLGISLSDEEKKQFNAMSQNERLAFIIDRVTQATGNMNAEFAKTDLGQMQQAKNTLGDLGEEAGKILLPALADIAKFLSDNILPKIQAFIDLASEHPIIGKIAVAITGVLAVGGPLLIFIGSIISAVGTLIPLMGGLELASLGVIGPFLAIAAAVAAVIAIGVLLYKHWDTIKEKASEVWDSIKNGVQNLWEKIKEVFSKIGEAMIAPFKKAIEIVKTIMKKIADALHIKIKLPHISIKPKGWGPGDLLKGKIPTLGVNWYKTGGIFSSPSVIGVGEGSSSEAVVPLDKFWSKMDNLTQSIVMAIQLGMSNNAVAAGDINVVVELEGAKVGEKIVKLYDRTKKAVG